VEVYLHTFFTSALHGGEWSASFPGHFTIWKEPTHPLDKRLGGPHSLSGSGGEEKEALAPVRNRSPLVQAVA